jgi:hypothetical protein
MFSTWKSRGVTMLNGVPDGNDPAAWTTAAKAAGFKYMREPLASASSDVGDTSLLAWSQPDEPDGIYSQVPYTTIQATYANWKSIDPSRAVSINFVGALNQYDLKTGESGTAWYQKYCAGADWLSADTYPLNNGGSISDVGVMLDKLRSFDATKPRFAFIESGDYDTTNGTTPPTADQFRGEVWEAVVHGARGISYFSVRVSGGFLWDMTPADVAQEMTKQDATLTALGPVLQGAINPAGVSASAASPLEVAWRVASSGGKYVIVLNQSAMARTGTVTVSGSSATSASVYGESRTVPVTSGAITDSFGAYAVHIYQMP